MADYYTDLSATSSGTGTEASPYTFAQVKNILEALSGSQSGNNYYFKRGSSAIGTVTITGASSFNLLAYGSGSRPVIDANYANDFATRLLNVQSVVVRGLHFTKGSNNSFSAVPSGGTIQNLEIYDCEGSWAYNLAGTGGRDGFDIDCGSTVTGTGIKFKGNVAHDNANNGAEFSYLNAAQLSDNIYYNNTSNGIEMWNSVINCTIERETAYECYRFIWFADQTGTHSTNTVKNCKGYNIKGEGFKCEGSTLNVFKNNSFYLKTTTVSGRPGWRIATSSSITVQNNIFHQYPSTNVNTDVCASIDTGSLTGLVANSNVYYMVDANGNTRTHKFDNNGSYLADIATWRTQTGQESNSTAYGNPAFVSPSNGDLRLSSSSQAIYTIVTTVAGINDDFNRDTRYGGIDAGALQYQRHATVNTTIDS